MSVSDSFVQLAYDDLEHGSRDLGFPCAMFKSLLVWVLSIRSHELVAANEPW